MAPLGDIVRRRTEPGIQVLAKPLRPARLLAAIEAPSVTNDAALPRELPEPEPAAAVVTPPADEQAPRILVVEDNPVNQRLAVRIVERLGYRASLARNGREGVEHFLREPADLVLMDCQMPEMNGFDATRAIRAAEREAAHDGRVLHVPIVAVTANAGPGNRAQCLESGMDEYLAKPLRVDDLRAVIDRLLACRP